MLLVTTSTAMFLAGVERLKFNEAVSRGHYPCAPITNERSYRLFDDHALVGLFVFGRMIEDDNPPRIAGRWACEVERAARSNPDASNIFFAQRFGGLPPIVLFSFDDLAERKDVARSRHFAVRAIIEDMVARKEVNEAASGGSFA